MKVLQIFLVVLHSYEAFDIPLVGRRRQAQTKGGLNINARRPHRLMENHRMMERARRRDRVRVHFSDNASNYLQWRSTFPNDTAPDESQPPKIIIPIKGLMFLADSNFSTSSYSSVNKTPVSDDVTTLPLNKELESINKTPVRYGKTIPPSYKIRLPNLSFNKPYAKATRTFINPYLSTSTKTLSFDQPSLSNNEPLITSNNKTQILQINDGDNDKYLKNEKVKNITTSSTARSTTTPKTGSKTSSKTTSRTPRTKAKAKINLEDNCGIDNSPNFFVNTGRAKIETYPWLGVLYYRSRGKTRITTPVVLVTKQLVLGAAMAIQDIPKHDFRASARVVIGHNCSHEGLGILEYNYHSEYRKSTYSSLVIVQLNNIDVGRYWNELRPICGPPKYILEPTFHAMILPNDCRYSRIEVHEMDYVSPEQCTNFYRRTKLDVSSIWPTRVVCSKGRSGGGCVWADGTVLALKQGGRWHLMGFGIAGPGCQAPSRFVDYSDYHEWVTKSVLRIGSPALTKMDENEVIIRQTEHIQRFGRCDIEEIKHELYTDDIILVAPSSPLTNRARYNVTLSHKFDYSCVSLSATYNFPSLTKVVKPKIRVHAFCLTPSPICHQAGFQIMVFDVTIIFKWRTMFKISVYGKDRSIVDQKSLIKYTNEKRVHVHIPWDWKQTTSEPTAKEQTATEDTGKEQTATEETAKEQTATEDTAKEQTATEETAKEQTATEETAKEQTATEPTG